MDQIRDKLTDLETYEELLLERDQLEKEADSIWIAYVQEFGELEAKLFERKIDSIRRKKAIAFAQQRINRGEAIDPAEMKKYLENVTAEHRRKLFGMLMRNQAAADAGTASTYELKRSKELYRKLAKLLHPDLNPETDRQPSLQELWLRVAEAYHASDIKALTELTILVRRELKELGLGDIQVDVPNLKDKIDEITEEIGRIKRTKPYCLKDLLEDEDAVKAKKVEMEMELASYDDYCRKLDETLRMMTGAGEGEMPWATD